MNEVGIEANFHWNAVNGLVTIKESPGLLKLCLRSSPDIARQVSSEFHEVLWMEYFLLRRLLCSTFQPLGISSRLSWETPMLAQQCLLTCSLSLSQQGVHNGAINGKQAMLLEAQRIS